MVTPEDGLSSRRTVAAGRRNNEYDEDMCEFLRIRFTPEDVPDEAGFLMCHDVNKISFDLRHASLSVSETALDASDGVVCSVTRTVRVLQTLPCVAMQTLDVTRAVSDKVLFIDHFVRAPMSYGNGAAAWTFDGSLYNTSAAQHFVLSAASSDCVGGGGMHAASYMGLGEVTCEGFNVIPGEGAGSEARVRLRVPPETESFTLHILCCCSGGKKARKSMLALLRAGTSASSLVSRHDMAWEALWQSRVDIVSKTAGMLQEETSAFMRDLFTLRMAMYQLHASCGGLMDLSGTSASGASCVHVAIASSLLLPAYRGQVVPLSRLHEDGVPELGLSGLYLDMVPWSDIGRWSDPATGAPRFLSPMSDGLRPFAGCMHAVSLWDTYRLSGDAGWLARVAFPVLSNVADMVCSMAQVGEAQSTIRLAKQTFKPVDNLQDSLYMLASSSNVPPPWDFEVRNTQGDLLNLTSTRCVSKEPLFATVKADAVAAISAKVKKQADELALLLKAATASGKIQLCACAATVIKAATGAVFETTSISRISNKGSTPEVTWLATKASLSPHEFSERFDKLLDRRNNSVAHQDTDPLLEEEVESCKELLSALPVLRIKYHWEGLGHRFYTELAAAFPLRFPLDYTRRN
eukprot:gene8458-biopygen3806